MKVFISWSGDRSKLLADALHTFLPEVIQAVKPFLSEADMNAGIRWPQRLNEELEQTHFGIICLTPENLNSNWLLYEAGALGKTLNNTFVCPCLLRLDASDVKWPLAQFQLSGSDEEGLRKIVKSINVALDGNALPEERLNTSFSRCYPETGKAIAAIPIQEAPNENATPHREDRELLEEVLSLLRERVSKRELPYNVSEALAYNVGEALGCLDTLLVNYNDETNKAILSDDTQRVVDSMKRAAKNIHKFEKRFASLLTNKRQHDLRKLRRSLSETANNTEDENFASTVEQLSDRVNKILSLVMKEIE